MAEKKDARKALSEVALATAQATLAAVENRSLKREEKEFILTEAILLGRSGLSSGRQKISRKVWDVYAANQIVQEIQGRFSAILEACAQELTQEKRDTPTVRGDLGYFLLAVVTKSANDLSLEFVQQMVDHLLFEYEGGGLDWTGQVWLSGVRVDETVEIRRGFSLRQPLSEDFNSEVSSDVFGFGQPLVTIPDAVLELTRKARDRPDLRREVNALSLFRLGAVEILQENWRSNSIFPYMGSNELPFRFISNPSFSYTLAKDEGSSLASFLERLPSDFPTKPIGHHDSSKWIGLKNYFLALHTATDVPERLTQAVVSLEALLLSDDEKQELTFKLSLRTASLLRFAGLDPMKIYNDVSTAYKVRSKYSHGAEIKKALLDSATDLCPRVMNYARLVVIKFIEFPDHKERKDLLLKLDLSLLDDEERQKLAVRLTGGLWTTR